MDVQVFWDNACNLFYVNYKGHKMYMSRKFKNEKEVAAYYKSVLMEQDEDSPHKYLTKDFNVENSDVVVDVGVAEGNFSLDIIDRVKKIYLIETDDDWLEALKMTFREYEDKVQIVKGYVSSVEEGPFVTLDSIISEPVNFIKMDIEGNEWDALQGAAKLIQKSENIRCAICSYHSDFDQTLIEAFFDGMDIKHNTSDGYMWFPWKVRQNYVSTRLNRALVRGEKMKITVIMPSLNVAPYIEKCIQSVVNQTLQDIEILCIDAGSTDGTLEILEQFKREDSRIRIIHSDKKSYGYQVNNGY